MDNYIMMQYFEWNVPADGKHWQRLRDDALHLAELGVSGVWIPPCTKAISSDDVGYGVYDLYDLGEFDQKGSIRTKYGTKQELQEAIQALHKNHLKVYADVVLNHKAGADETERFQVVMVDPQNRERAVSEPFEIEGWTRFTYPGRKGEYSNFQWNWMHFTGTDFDQTTGNKNIFRIIGENKYWSKNVGDEFGNYDYLMYADVDYQNQEVVAETLSWGEWFINEMHIDGMRLDAIKHINEEFVEKFVRTLREKSKGDFYVVGEYWENNTNELREYLSDVNYHLSLVDVKLHYNFYEASKRGRNYDLRQIFNGTLVEGNPLNVMTFVDNHDSQPEQALQSWVEEWFKPMAYALIMLRRDGYPCLFYGDYYGIGDSKTTKEFQLILESLLEARRLYAYGKQIDTFDHNNIIAWQRLGEPEHLGSGLAVLISNDDEGSKTLSFGPKRAGTIWHDITRNRSEIVTLDEQGTGGFVVSGRSVSVWVRGEV